MFFLSPVEMFVFLSLNIQVISIDKVASKPSLRDQGYKYTLQPPNEQTSSLLPLLNTFLA